LKLDIDGATPDGRYKCSLQINFTSSTFPAELATFMLTEIPISPLSSKLFNECGFVPAMIVSAFKLCEAKLVKCSIDE
jgi:hypothetical protein